MGWEAEMLLWIQEYIRNPVITPWMQRITSLGNYGAVWLVLAAFFICIKPMRRAGAYMFAAIALSFFVNNLFLKPYVGRIRPYEVVEGLKLLASRPSDASFPSGHTACAAAAALAFWMTAGKEGGKKRALGIGLLVLAALIACSRLYLGVHYPTDVAAGAVSGGLMAWISVKYFHFPDS